MKPIFPTEMINPEVLRPHPKNYRNHKQDQLDHLKKSIEEHGFYKNVVVSEDGFILAGHGVVKAALQMKLKQIPIHRIHLKADHPKAMKVVTGDNEIGNLAEVDDRLLSELLKGINEEKTLDLLGTGFDEKQLANLVYVTRDKGEIKDHNAAAEWVGLPSYDDEDPTLKEEVQLIVKFPDQKTRDEFCLERNIEVKMKKSNGKWITDYPFVGKDDSSSVKFEAE